MKEEKKKNPPLTKTKSVAKKPLKGKKGGTKKAPAKRKKPTKNGKRGRPTKQETATVMKAKREKAVELLVGFSEISKNRTMEQIADEVGINKTTLYEWLDDDKFQEMCDDLIDKERKRLRARCERSFYNALIEEGDASRMKLFLQAYEGFVPTEKRDGEVVVKQTINLKKTRVSKDPKK